MTLVSLERAGERDFIKIKGLVSKDQIILTVNWSVLSFDTLDWYSMEHNN